MPKQETLETNRGFRMLSLVNAVHVPGVYIAARNLLSASVVNSLCLRQKMGVEEHVTDDNVDQWESEDVLVQPITKTHCLRRKMRMVRTCHSS